MAAPTLTTEPEPRTEPDDPHPSRAGRPRRRRIVLGIVAGVSVIALAAGGAFAGNAIAVGAARDRYETAVAELEATREDSRAATATLATAIAELRARVEAAEALAAQLGAEGDTLAAAVAATEAARAAVDSSGPVSPAPSAGTVPDGAGVAEYDELEAATRELIGSHERFAAALRLWTAGIGQRADDLRAAWTAHAQTAPASAEQAVAAAPNAAQELKDAVAAAADAVVALEDPLDAEAPALWAAFAEARSQLAAAEQAYQEQLAAQQAARPGSGGRRPGSSGSGGPPPGWYEASLAQIEAALAAERGISPSDVHCYDIPNGIRCEYPGGWREITI